MTTPVRIASRRLGERCPEDDARPTLEALPDGPRQEFEVEFRTALRHAYPSTRHGTVLPFRRVFVVARRPGPWAP